MDYANMTMSELIAARKENNENLNEANKVVSGFKDIEDLIDAAIIGKFEAEGTKRAATDDGSVSMQVIEEPNVTDWDAFYAHVLATKDFSILQRRVTSTAIRELWKLGSVIPGVDGRIVKRINFRKG